MATVNLPIADAPNRPAIPPPDREGNSPEPHHGHKHSPGYWVAFVLVLLAAALLVGVFAWLPRHRNQQEIEKRAKAEQNAVPRVQVVKVNRAPAESELLVPGTTQAFTEVNIYARASGYVTKRLVDIGDHVHTGQLLAVIDAPDLDRQVAQARSSLRESQSNLGQLEAQLHLASLNWDRYKVLVARGVFSRQEGDTQEANFRVAEANVRAAESTIQGNRENLERLIILQGYERVTAPFSGVVTARNVDLGTLITAQGTGVASSSATLPGSTQAAAEANNSGTSGNVSSSTSPSTGGSQGGVLFTISDTQVFRILVSVPEAYSSLIKTGQQAALNFQELPNQKFTGRVTRSSASIDQNTRTLLVELQVHNRNGVLMPGMYAQVNLIQSTSAPALLVPGEAIVIRDGKNAVALVQNQVVHFRPVTLGRDYGEQTEVTGGLEDGDVVAVNVSDEVSEGARIQPQFAAAKAQSASQSRGGQSDRQPQTDGRYGNANLANQGSGKSSGGKSNGAGSANRGNASGQNKQ